MATNIIKLFVKLDLPAHASWTDNYLYHTCGVGGSSVG